MDLETASSQQQSPTTSYSENEEAQDPCSFPETLKARVDCSVRRVYNGVFPPPFDSFDIEIERDDTAIDIRSRVEEKFRRRVRETRGVHIEERVIRLLNMEINGRIPLDADASIRHIHELKNLKISAEFEFNNPIVPCVPKSLLRETLVKKRRFFSENPGISALGRTSFAAKRSST